jgi:hypothetical protein
MRFSFKTEKRGSALLVVLGFLSFMIISAVSFAVYMRVERQSSSSYRHAVVGRHLLETALYRAMDQVDADLRGNRYQVVEGNEVPDASSIQKKKFPDHWQVGGRFFTSSADNSDPEPARVLSLEALSFLPASLVNEARVTSLDAQWRRMSIVSGTERRDVGRYAFLCVNVSDMLNVNGCTNAVRTGSNLVSIASLLTDPTSSVIFDWPKAKVFAERATQDIHYSTLQDFYACMKGANSKFLSSETDSPSLDFFENGNSELFNYDNARNHLLVTDGFAKAPATAPDQVCNLGVPSGQPFAAGALNGSGFAAPALQADFVAAFQKAFPAADNSYILGVLPGLLADYLATDANLTWGLDTPSVKLTPMICQFIIANNSGAEIKTHVEGSGASAKSVVDVQLIEDMGAPTFGNFGLQARVCYPFKNIATERQGQYTLEVKGFISVLQNRSGEPTSATLASRGANELRYEFTGTGTFNPASILGQPPSENACYVTVDLLLAGDAVNNKTIPMIDEDGTIKTPGFAEGSDFSVVLGISSAMIKNSKGSVVDMVPCNRLVAAVKAKDPSIDIPLPLLYFETAPVRLQKNLAAAKMPYEWRSLEVPDPRFNHFTMNWVNNYADDYGIMGMHQVTRSLLGNDGRDTDIFMRVSNMQYLQSPGELGFLIRPYQYRDDIPTNYRNKKTIDPNTDDSEAFFRTVRLYKQGNKDPDYVYERFMNAADAQGTLPLANRVRINPLSTSTNILKLAITGVPFDYSISTLPETENITEKVFGGNKTSWEAFASTWASQFSQIVATDKLNEKMDKSIASCTAIAQMNWYDVDKRRCLGVALPNELFNADRKMMYAFSLDSMSDRQQLFLYFFQAEVIAPLSLAKSRSLAGGRAIAVVARDPYPKTGTTDYYEHKVLFFKQLDN